MLDKKQLEKDKESIFTLQNDVQNGDPNAIKAALSKQIVEPTGLDAENDKLVTENGELLKKAKTEAEKQQKTLKIDGFRKGKVPTQMYLKRFGEGKVIVAINGLKVFFGDNAENSVELAIMQEEARISIELIEALGLVTTEKKE